MEQSHEEYREYVHQNLEKVLEVLAHISFGEFVCPVPEELMTLPDFGEVYCGLDVLMGDFREFRSEIKKENAFSKLRAETWKHATITEEDSVQLARNLIEPIGTHIQCTGVCYFEINEATGLPVCVAEWTPHGEMTVLDMQLPPELWLYFKGKPWMQLSVKDLEANGQQELAGVFRQFETGSFLAATCGMASSPHSFFVFADKDEDRTWSERDKRLLSELVNIVSVKIAKDDARIALENANEILEEEVRKRTQELREANKELKEDIKKIRQAERKMRKQEEELLRARKLESVGTLAGGLAHDFNNILTGIVGNLFLVKGKLISDPDSMQMVSEVEEAALRARRLTTQLLTFSKGGNPVTEVLSLHEIVKSSVQFSLSGTNLVSRLEIDDDVFPVNADKGQIDQVLSNLLINAAQAMPKGGQIVVCVQNRLLTGDEDLPLKKGKYVCVSVKDSGPGITKKIGSRVFDPYFTTKQGGSGLGLATAYSIIHKHKGHLGFESKEGEGTTFMLYLPATVKAPPKSDTVNTPVNSGEGRGTVLVMDDDPAVRLVMERTLGWSGFTTHGVKNGEEALSAYRSAKEKGRPFILVIMDLTIRGGKGGKETVRELLDYDSDARAVVVSGYSNDPIMSSYRDYGFVGVISKPFRTQEFMDIVNAAIGR